MLSKEFCQSRMLGGSFGPREMNELLGRFFFFQQRKKQLALEEGMRMSGKDASVVGMDSGSHGVKRLLAALKAMPVERALPREIYPVSPKVAESQDSVYKSSCIVQKKLLLDNI